MFDIGLAKRAAGVAVAIVVGAGTFVVTSNVVAATDVDKSEVPADGWALSDFPTNDHGLSYGSVAAVEDPDDAPDLIAVIGKSGKRGFIRKEDQNRPGEETQWVIPVYANDGVTQIDTFEVQEGRVISFETLEELEAWEAQRRAGSSS